MHPDLVDFHRRPTDPDGAVFQSYEAGGRAVHVYRRADRTERRPVVVLLHGGAWRENTPFMLIRYAHLFASRGWVAVCPEYRFTTEAVWPAQLHDVVAACDWVATASSELGADPARFAVMGNSAGGQLAFFLARELGGVARALVLLYPVTDLRPAATPLIAAMGATEALLGSMDEAALAAASPIDHVRPCQPPTLTMTGSADELTPVASLEAFHEALTASGVVNELHVFPGLGHAFDLLPEHWPRACTSAEEFLRQHVAPV